MVQFLDNLTAGHCRSCDELLSRYGNDKIFNMRIMKSPINSTLDKILDWLSLGIYGEKKQELNYDNMYHLYLLVLLRDTEGDICLRIEKNEFIEINISTWTVPEDAIYMDILPVNFPFITLNEFISNGMMYISSVLKLDPYMYNPTNNNCQVFIQSLLISNGYNYRSFIMQDTEQLIGSMPSLVRGVIDEGVSIGKFLSEYLMGK